MLECDRGNPTNLYICIKVTVYKPAGPISSSVADTVPTTVPIVIFSGCVIRYGFPPLKDANDGALSFTSEKKKVMVKVS